MLYDRQTLLSSENADNGNKTPNDDLVSSSWTSSPDGGEK